MPAPAPKNDSILNVVTTILTSRETVPIYWSVACFVPALSSSSLLLWTTWLPSSKCKYLS
ncbi:Tom6 [Yarrowia lipolytica]|nr:Tom6 [Yarrowia lipolytica]